MMIDFALEAERERGQVAGRSDLPGLPAAFPSHHDDDHGRAARRCAAGASARGTGSELRRPLGITIVGGLLLSQLLTLYTTPVVYLWFDRWPGASSVSASADANPACRKSRRRGDERMNISAPFIRRPVATSLLTVALLLAGILAFTFCCRWRRCRRSSIPVISVGRGLPGASPETMASAVATPLERQFGRIAGVNQMTSIEPARLHQHHSAVRSESQHRCRGARRAGSHQCCARPASGQSAHAILTIARSILRTRPS